MKTYTITEETLTNAHNKLNSAGDGLLDKSARITIHRILDILVGKSVSPEQTFKLGSKLTHKETQVEYMICKPYDKGHSNVAMVNLSNGGIWKNLIRVTDVQAITEKELNELVKRKNWKDNFVLSPQGEN